MGVWWQVADWLLGLGRYRARVAVREAVRGGQIERRTVCEECSAEMPSLHRHHSDYRQPLDVRWLCPPCHRTEHTRSNREAARRYRARQEEKSKPKEEQGGGRGAGGRSRGKTTGGRSRRSRTWRLGWGRAGRTKRWKAIPLTPK